MSALKEARYDDPVLCYVEEPWAWFTTRQLDKQWGDDWDDVPYETNAGDPYEFSTHHQDLEPWQIVRVAFSTPEATCPGGGLWSVQMINDGKTPWLILHRYDERTRRSHQTVVMAGTSLSEFKKKIRENGGDVYTRDA